MHPENSKRIFMLASLLLLAVNWKAGAREAWHFLPTFGHDVRGVEQLPTDGRPFHASIPKSAQKLLSPEGKLTEKQCAEFHWHPATFPHQDFVRLMPERRVFGWYGCEFGVPTELSGMDVLADLGIIDDSDETFVNGRLVGKTGKVPDGSAWQTDRLYRISYERLKRERNVLAVHVWSLWGLGGIVGPPVLKASLAPAGAEWHLAFVKDSVAPASDLNRATTAKDALASFANGGKPLDWRKVSLPWNGYAAWRDDEHYAVFKLNFELKNADSSPKSFSKTMVMDAGPVFDVAAFYLNGRRIGLVGRFPHGEEPAFTEAAQRARFTMPPDAWSADGRNEIIAVVYRERGVGGLPGVPGLLLSSPMDHQPQTFGDVTDAFLIQLQSGDLSQAEAVLTNSKPKTDTERVWLLSHRAHLAFLKWHDGGQKDAGHLDGVLAPIAEILAKYPVESPKQSAMQAFCRVLRLAEINNELSARVQSFYPNFKKNNLFLESDRQTHGNWPLFYGNRYYILAAMGQICDWTIGTLYKPLNYSTRIPSNLDYPRLWLDINNRFVDWNDALLMHGYYQRIIELKQNYSPEDIWEGLFSGVKIRRGSWWDDHGEMHPFDEEGPDLILTSEIPEDCCMISCYLTDHDWSNTTHPRQQSVIVFDEKRLFMNACWSGKSHKGSYERIAIEGCKKINIRINKHRSPCVAISGFFVDIPPAFFNIKEANTYKEITSIQEAIININNAKGLEKIRTARLYSSLFQLHLSTVKESDSIYALVYGIESGFESYKISREIAKAFATLDTIEKSTNLMKNFSSGQNFHFIWHYMVFARLYQLFINNKGIIDMKNRCALLRALPREEQYMFEKLINNKIFGHITPNNTYEGN